MAGDLHQEFLYLRRDLVLSLRHKCVSRSADLLDYLRRISQLLCGVATGSTADRIVMLRRDLCLEKRMSLRFGSVATADLYNYLRRLTSFTTEIFGTANSEELLFLRRDLLMAYRRNTLKNMEIDDLFSYLSRLVNAVYFLVSE